MRAFLSLILLLALGAARAQQPAPLNLAVSYPRNLASVFATVEDFQRRVNAEGAGRLSIRVHASGEMLPAFGVLDGVQKDLVPMAWTAPAFFGARDPMYTLIGSPLFAFQPAEYVAWRRRPEVAAQVDQFYEANGIHGALCGMVAETTDLVTRIPVRSVEELKTAKLAAGGLYGLMLRQAGAPVQAMAALELAPALRHQAIEGVEWASASDMAVVKLQEHGRHLYHPSSARAFIANDLWISLAAWQQLDDGARAVIDKACADAVEGSLRRTAQNNRDAVAALQKQGVTVEPLPADIQEAMKAAWLRYAFGVAPRNEPFGRLLATLPQ